MGRRSNDNPIDWELIEKEFRLGQLTLRQMATNHGVEASNISRRARKEGWVRDRSDEVRARSEAQLLARSANHEKSTPTDDDIQIAATTRTQIILAHREGLGRARRLAMRLFEQLEKEGDKVGDKDALDLDGSAKVLKNLADSMQKVIVLERVAFGLDTPEADDREKVKVLVMPGGKDAPI